jgi:hypothetical protein
MAAMEGDGKREARLQAALSPALEQKRDQYRRQQRGGNDEHQAPATVIRPAPAQAPAPETVRTERAEHPSITPKHLLNPPFKQAKRITGQIACKLDSDDSYIAINHLSFYMFYTSVRKFRKYGQVITGVSGFAYSHQILTVNRVIGLYASASLWNTPIVFG